MSNPGTCPQTGIREGVGAWSTGRWQRAVSMGTRLQVGWERERISSERQNKLEVWKESVCRDARCVLRGELRFLTGHAAAAWPQVVPSLVL